LIDLSSTDLGGEVTFDYRQHGGFGDKAMV
jgi:hypothetical protein